MATVLDSVQLSSLRAAEPVIDFDQARVLAERYGTPLLVVSRTRLAQNYLAMRSNLPGVELFYAAKANCNEHILRTLCELGCSVDVCTWGEMKAALAAGFSTDNMIHTHPCKTERNLMDCYEAGCRWFVYDNRLELEKIARLTPDVNLLLRVAMSSASSLINLSAKFGASAAEAVDLLVAARRSGMNVRGMSFHVGSQTLCPEDFHNAFRQARRIWDEAAALGIELEVLDIGGGFPAPYKQSVLTLDEYCRSLSEALSATFGDLPIRLIAEPGRGMCADTVSLVTRVLGKNVRGGLPWYVLDDGLYGSFSGIVYDHVEFPLIAERHLDRPVSPCVVAGPTCDSTDIVCRDQELPDLEVGEMLLVPTMGAYTSASASTFNGLDLARVISIE